MTLQTAALVAQQKAGYRYVKYTFFKVDPVWRKLSSREREFSKKQFLSSLSETGDKIRPRSYSLVGTRGDVDFMLWTITDSLETLQGFHADLLKTELGKYLFVYPLTKKREWYSLPFDERRRIMKDHVQAGQKYPSVTIHTSYSFGIDDYEFILSFETDHPEDFLNLVMDLRTTEASKYTALETPIFTCLNVEPGKMLDLIGP